MSEDNNRYADKNDNAAKTLASIGIIIAVLALGWAMKADNKAGDAFDRAESSQQSQNAVRTMNTEKAASQTSGTSNTESTAGDSATPASTNP